MFSLMIGVSKDTRDCGQTMQSKKFVYRMIMFRPLGVV